MSFVVAEPESVRVAAQGLAGIRESLAEAMASAAVPTTGVVAAAQDGVSARIAAVFGTFGQEYQAAGAQAQAFHEQFVNLLNAGAGAYLGTEIANAEQNLLGAAIPGPCAALRSAALPGLGGVGSLLGDAAPPLAGQIGSGLQSLSGYFARPLAALSHGLAPAMARTGTNAGLATVEGPYQTLFANTLANLQTLGGAISANPAPFLHQFIANQITYAQMIASGVEYVIQNLPTVLANLPANIQAAIQAFLAFDPAPYIQQFIANQMAFAQIWATSLQNAAYDFGTGLQALPAAFQSAFHALQMGDIGGAVSDVAQGFINLFATGVSVTTTGTLPGTLYANVALTGTLGDLGPILGIPAMKAQNFTNLLPPGSIPAQISQHVTNVIGTVTDTSLTAVVVLKILPPALSVSAHAGLPLALTIEALGPPIDGFQALANSTTAFVDAVQTGDWSGAATTLIDAPAVVADAFLNGQSTLPVTFDISGYPLTVNVPLNGLLVPPTPYTASITVSGIPITVPVGGTPISGLATGLLVYAPEQLALAIGA